MAMAKGKTKQLVELEKDIVSGRSLSSSGSKQ
jgi:hypothetical protein